MPAPPFPAQSPTTTGQNTFFSTVLNNPQSTSSTTSPSSRFQPPSTSAAAQPPFTATQRSAQARHKDYTTRANGPQESYEARQRRDEAACILDSSEMLMWFAASRNEVRGSNPDPTL